MEILPNLASPRISQSTQMPSQALLERLDHLIIAVPLRPTGRDFQGLPQSRQLKQLFARAEKDARVTTRAQNRRGTGITAARFPGDTRFAQLSWARELVGAAGGDKPRSIGVIACGLGDQSQAAVTAIVAALLAAAFPMPSFKSETARVWKIAAIKLLGLAERLDVSRLEAAAHGNALARWLTALPPNKLTALAYRNALQALAKRLDLRFEFFDERRLARLGAGAFLAVSQGNSERDAGIARLSYRHGPKQSAELALVGKGIVFDTGGTNLKPFTSMLKMHTDMQGSAVAVGALAAMRMLNVPYGVDAWLAITENRLAANAYKPQDVVTAIDGTTIQTIHTDAEGRMVLADTLALAARKKPKLIMDYATLTGACVGALTEKYSGVFSNRLAANVTLRRAGATCGERVWPFPMDPDYDELLRSDVADIKQCAASGSGDHILAARFLSRFVPEAIPWIHLDLSAGEHKGGLAHIPTDITGFGVDLTLELFAGESPAAVARSWS